MASDINITQEIKKKVSVPMYFYNIILPQRADYYSDYHVDFDAKPVVKCPVHDEDTPSMRYYEETNTFFCFGCRAGGDVIELHRVYTEKMTGIKPSFDESIEFLYNFFVKGLLTSSVLGRAPSKEEPLSSQVELIRYTNYINTLERSLLVDTAISNEVKYIIWAIMDEVDILVSKNLLNSMEALKYIKSMVYKLIV